MCSETDCRNYSALLLFYIMQTNAHGEREKMDKNRVLGSPDIQLKTTDHE